MFAAPKNADQRASHADLMGIACLGLSIIAAVPVFWLGLASLARAWATPEYSHGPLIPLVSLFLLLRELRRDPLAPTGTPANRWPGIALIIVALGLGVLGNLVQIPDIVTYALILWIGGLVLTGFGLTQGRRHGLPVLHLVFMLPLPQGVFWQLSIFLQGVSSELGVWFLTVVGVPVYLDGNIIDLGVYKLQVAEACSGLRYLFPILSFSYLSAILYRGPIWHKLVLLVTAAPLTVLLNSARIAGIGVLVNSYGIAQAEGFLHLFQGWAMFLVCIAALFGLALGLQRLSKDPKPLAETIDLDMTGFRAVLARLPGMEASRGWVIATSVSLAIAAGFMLYPASDLIRPDRDPFALFPHRFGAWIGETGQLDPAVEQVLAADDYISAVYAAPDEAIHVSLFVAYYDNQAQGAGIHSPEVCLPAGGWEIAAIDVQGIDLANTPFGPFFVNRAVIQRGLARQLVYYWFDQRGQRMTSGYLAKASVVVDSLTRGRSDGALVRLITPILPGETDAEADARIQRFMTLALGSMSRFIPE